MFEWEQFKSCKKQIKQAKYRGVVCCLNREKTVMGRKILIMAFSPWMLTAVPNFYLWRHKQLLKSNKVRKQKSTFYNMTMLENQSLQVVKPKSTAIKLHSRYSFKASDEKPLDYNNCELLLKANKTWKFLNWLASKDTETSSKNKLLDEKVHLYLISSILNLGFTN